MSIRRRFAYTAACAALCPGPLLCRFPFRLGAFYSRLNEILDRAKFDTYAERICRKYYATTMGAADTGGMRRVHLRGKNNIAKRALIHARQRSI